VLQKHRETGSHFKYVNLDPRVYLDEIALVSTREVLRCVVRQGKSFKVASIQGNDSFSFWNDLLSVMSDEASEEDGRDGDDHQQNWDSCLQGLCLRFEMDRRAFAVFAVMIQVGNMKVSVINIGPRRNSRALPHFDLANQPPVIGVPRRVGWLVEKGKRPASARESGRAASSPRSLVGHARTLVGIGCGVAPKGSPQHFVRVV
jgi:hypothetical protein